jgi:hypothetical protein
VELLMEFEIGSIVKIEKYSGEYVIIGMENYEDYGSCSYNRNYYVMKLSDVENKNYINENQGTKIKCRGTTLPFTKVNNIAPFKFIKEVRYKVDRMQAKTITIYE